MGHPEYDRYTLHNEYERDKKKGLDIDMPVNYYPDNDDTQKPLYSGDRTAIYFIPIGLIIMCTRKCRTSS